VKTIHTCGICGDKVESRIPTDWHPSNLANRVEWDLAAHLRTHSFAEILRFEIRQDLDQVPDEQRPSIVRDIYRNLLGRPGSDPFELGAPDGSGVYSIDEALGSLDLLQLWRSANRCSDSYCRH
jgi:hypothetical protein